MADSQGRRAVKQENFEDTNFNIPLPLNQPAWPELKHQAMQTYGGISLKTRRAE
jgi:hypothetical protein